MKDIYISYDTKRSKLIGTAEKLSNVIAQTTHYVAQFTNEIPETEIVKLKAEAVDFVIPYYKKGYVLSVIAWDGTFTTLANATDLESALEYALEYQVEMPHADFAITYPDGIIHTLEEAKLTYWFEV